MSHARSIFLLVAVVTLSVLGATASAFNCETTTAGPLTMTVGDPGLVDAVDRPYDVPVLLENRGAEPLAVKLTASVIDTYRIVGESEKRTTVPPGAKQEATFQIAAGGGTYSAHYPVRVEVSFYRAGEPESPASASAVRVFETQLTSATPRDAASGLQPPTVVPTRGGVLLTGLDTHQIAWGYDGEPLQRLPVGWQGSEPTSRASFGRNARIERGATRHALTMHPPYRPQGGPVVAEYPLALPAEGPITLSFFNAIRDNADHEPASDGVTFRVWVREKDDPNSTRRKLFDRHTDSKTWLPAEVDLTPYAGRPITLGLEAHPGPRRNTVCDSCYWGDPVVFAGEKPDVLSEHEHRRVLTLAAQGAAGAASPNTRVHAFSLGDTARAAVALGPNGLFDGALAFANGSQVVTYDGLNVAIEGSRVGQWPSSLVTEQVDVQRVESARIRITHDLRLDRERFPLTVEVWPDGPALRVKVDCPHRITDISLGPASHHARRVYFGHGFCVTEPRQFEMRGGGHGLSTSHVGFEFEEGPALLMATDTPPDHLKVDPDSNIYTLHVHPQAMLTFVPAETAFEAAIRYRPLYDKRAAPGVANKAGRLVFDLWGGNFKADTEMLRQAFAYGVTDAMVIKHVWQRWGYDVRLPDIWPPRPEWGGLDDLKEMADICRENGVLFGLHDNYIDFYPDAEGFTYDHITFHEDGRPRKAWINMHAEAQSYQWRPDRFRPFLERNLAMIKPAINPTASFVDVFTSANVFDYYDRGGRFHSRLETRDRWGQCFDIIRDTLGNNAATVSESGDDFLIGHLDGADCQFLQLTENPQRYQLRVPCESWSRVPWFDAVNHTRFSLHGVGYSGRYQGGRSRQLHGIMSDDYISAEILTGHALMVDRGSMLRGAVRKYWLAQDIVRELKADEIDRVQYGDGNPDLLEILWEHGAFTFVNRSAKDVKLGEATLPPFGYLAMSADRECVSSIQRIDGVVVETRAHGDAYYVNGRGCLPDGPLAITPRAHRIESLGGRRFKLLVDWKADRPAPKDLKVFYHIFKPQVSRLKLEGWYAGGGEPNTPTGQWEGMVRTGEGWTITVPEDVEPGEYDVLVGLYEGNRRYPLLGNDDGQTRYRIGKIAIEGDDGEVTGIRLTKTPYVEPLADRLIPNTKPIDFGVAVTTGGMRIERNDDRIVVTPLPLETDCDVTLKLDRLGHHAMRVTAIEAIDVDGRTIRDVPLNQSGNEVAFRTECGEFAYHVRLTCDE